MEMEMEMEDNNNNPSSFAPDEAAGVATVNTNTKTNTTKSTDNTIGSLFKGLTVVDSPPSSPRPNTTQSSTNTTSSSKDDGDKITHGYDTSNKNASTNANLSSKNEIENKEDEEDDDGTSADGTNVGTPSSSTKSEESGVLVEKEDAEEEESTLTKPVREETTTTSEQTSNDTTNEATAATAENDQDGDENGYEATNDQNQIDMSVDEEEPIFTCFIHPSTPIPNSDSSLRLLRKFVTKTSKHFPIAFGGTKPPSFINYLFGSSNVDIADECCYAYKDLIEILTHDDDALEEEDRDLNNCPSQEHEGKENEVVIESILGHSGDTMSKARQAMAAFCRLVETWCLETQRLSIVEKGGDMTEFINVMETSYFYDMRYPEEDGLLYSLSSNVTTELMAIALASAEALVAHGCFDGVIIGIGEEQSTLSSNFDLNIMPSIDEENDMVHTENEREEDSSNHNNNNQNPSEPEYVNAVTVLAESIFHCHLDSEELELSALKFLLTTGCRTTTNSETGYDEAMLRGSRLLQTIRVCYRVYLSTQSEANKTTAKAALRQIVISAFKRLEIKSQDSTSVGLSKQKPIVFGKGDDPFNTQMMDDMDENENDNETSKQDDPSTAAMSYGGKFSTFEHKDAYLVLRSLCKLSMKATVGGSFQNMVVIRDGSARSLEKNASSMIRNSSTELPRQEMMMNPALDSKILALDLLVDILQGTKTDILMNAGPQLIYAVRNYLCHSLLKNCTSDNNYVVSLSLRLFVPIIRHFRSHLKTEIEAFVTNVFFVILDSKNSTIEHKLRVVILFEEICSDPATLAEIFLNYDCDLSAVDLFQRIVSTLAKVAKIGLHDQGMNSGGIFVAGAGATRAEKSRQDHRELRLEAMKAVKQVLSSLHESFAAPMMKNDEKIDAKESKTIDDQNVNEEINPDSATGTDRQSLVQIYDSKKKRREEAAKATLKFNQKPTAGIKFATEVGLINGDDPADVAQFLLNNKDILDKTQIGEYLGREPEYQNGYPLKVLHEYLNLLDFTGLLFDDAIKFYLSGFRLPGEAQKVNKFISSWFLYISL